MLDGVDLPEPGNHKELALIYMKHRQNKIKSMETYLISKALFASNAEDPDSKRTQINDYNKILSEYQDLLNPAKPADRKKFERSFKDQAKALKNMTIKDIIGDKILTLGKESKGTFTKNISSNWKKVE